MQFKHVWIRLNPFQLSFCFPVHFFCSFSRFLILNSQRKWKKTCTAGDTCPLFIPVLSLNNSLLEYIFCVTGNIYRNAGDYDFGTRLLWQFFRNFTFYLEENVKIANSIFSSVECSFIFPWSYLEILLSEKRGGKNF